jgi:predicted flap endonuclease-1-like 5' DNA nuclease
MALVLRDWTRSGCEQDVAEHHNCYPFEVRRLVECGTRLLQAMAAVWLAIQPEVSSDSSTAEPGVPPARSQHEHPATGNRVATLERMLRAGIDEVAASLLTIDGIGPTIARRLVALDVRDVEDLADVNAAELAPRLRGVSVVRLARWIEAAASALQQVSAFHFLERDVNTACATLREWPADVDPYRLRRAADLTVTSLKTGIWQVAGGLEPHQVAAEDSCLRCDCADAARGQRCKHILAVRLASGDEQLRVLLPQLEGPASDTLDLTTLWMSGGMARGGHAA